MHIVYMCNTRHNQPNVLKLRAHSEEWNLGPITVHLTSELLAQFSDYILRHYRGSDVYTSSVLCIPLVLTSPLWTPIAELNSPMLCKLDF